MLLTMSICEDLSSDASHEDEDIRQLYQARQIWLAAPTQQMMNQVEEVHRRIWNHYRRRHHHPRRGSSRSETMDAEKSCDEQQRSAYVVAGERLALILLQSGRVQEADEILHELGYTCRLARSVFQPETIIESIQRPRMSSTLIPCQVWDSFLPLGLLRKLQSIFCPVDAPYWTDHHYRVEPPTPYFSYLVPLNDVLPSTSSENVSSNCNTLLARVIQQVYQQIAVTFKPIIANAATACELWAHNRPLPTGHQLHFDTDNEGCDRTLLHPLVTCILYLSAAGVGGGPTLITNQRLVSPHAADRGWLASAQENRAVLMDGRVLHCVVPGRVIVEPSETKDAVSPAAGKKTNPETEAPSAQQHRRVTLMLAFWKRIRLRDEATHGAARPLPGNASWAQALQQPVEDKEATVTTDATMQSVPPTALSHVYESVPEGKPWTRQMGLPAYDQVFQGV